MFSCTVRIHSTNEHPRNMHLLFWGSNGENNRTSYDADSDAFSQAHPPTRCQPDITSLRLRQTQNSSSWRCPIVRRYLHPTGKTPSTKNHRCAGDGLCPIPWTAVADAFCARGVFVASWMVWAVLTNALRMPWMVIRVANSGHERGSRDGDKDLLCLCEDIRTTVVR